MPDGAAEGTRACAEASACPGLFATAYGNVGSSIYYALGLVAAHALGLTPLVFIFAGGLFALTAKTYAEGASMFPEAGGSSSFARHAFNEVVSFFAGWGLSLDYIITVAISAFFVPHYLGAFFPALGHGPWRRDRRRGRDRRPRPAQHPRDRRVDAAEHLPRDHRPAHPGRPGRARRRPGPRPGRCSSTRSTSGSAPSYSQLLFAVSISMIAYTGIETVSNMAEEARDPGEDVPRTVNYVLIAVLGIFAGISIVSISALPVTQDAAGHYSTAARHHLQGRPRARASSRPSTCTGRSRRRPATTSASSRRRS